MTPATSSAWSSASKAERLRDPRGIPPPIAQTPKNGVVEGDRGDLNPRPPGPQPGALTKLSYGHHVRGQDRAGPASAGLGQQAPDPLDELDGVARLGDVVGARLEAQLDVERGGLGRQQDHG